MKLALLPALIVAMGLSGAPAFADGGGVRGFAVDWKSHQPMGGIVVTLRGPVGVYQAMAHKDGFFAFLGLLPGAYRMTVYGSGYVLPSCWRDVTVRADEVVDLDRSLELSPAPKVLGHISVCTGSASRPTLVDPTITADVYDLQ